MFGKLLMMLGIRKAQQKGWLSRNKTALAPLGGALPAIAWLAWTNRDKIASAYREYVQPRIDNLRAQPTATAS